jgi:hypothetical protein
MKESRITISFLISVYLTVGIAYLVPNGVP